MSDEETIYSFEDDNVFHTLRFTPYDDKIDINKVSKFLDENFMYWVVGFETTVNNHYHMVYSGEKIEKDILQKYFENDRIKGNKYFSCTESKDLNKSVMYAVKDGTYKSSDIWITYCDSMYSRSFEKPQSYQKQLSQLYVLFQAGRISQSKLWEDICLARCYFDLGINFYKIDELVRTQVIKRDPELLKIYSRERNLFSC